jgi:hypothetical protein
MNVVMFAHAHTHTLPCVLKCTIARVCLHCPESCTSGTDLCKPFLGTHAFGTSCMPHFPHLHPNPPRRHPHLPLAPATLPPDAPHPSPPLPIRPPDWHPRFARDGAPPSEHEWPALWWMSATVVLVETVGGPPCGGCLDVGATLVLVDAVGSDS